MSWWLNMNSFSFQGDDGFVSIHLENIFLNWFSLFISSVLYFAGWQRVRLPQAVAQVDGDPAPEVHQEEGAAVGEQERRCSTMTVLPLNYRINYFPPASRS